MFRSVAQRVLATTHYVASKPGSMGTLAGSSSATTKFFSSAAAAPAQTPTVQDVLIDLTFIDPSGARRKVKGLIGK